MTQNAHEASDGLQEKPPPRERILRAADALFERYGIRGVGVEAIAEAAETNKMTLYRHFASKDDLVAAWLQRLVDEWIALWDEIEGVSLEGDSRAQLDRFIEEFGAAFERVAARGCPFMNSLAELPEKDHPARRVLDDYKAFSRKRMTRFFRRVGVSGPAQAAEEVQLLLDGAKAGIQDCGVASTRARFVRLAKTLLHARLASD